jgi:hypothetical protein
VLTGGELDFGGFVDETDVTNELERVVWPSAIELEGGADGMQFKS